MKKLPKETSISQFTAVKAKGASLVPLVPALALPSQRNIEPSHRSTMVGSGSHGSWDF